MMNVSEAIHSDSLSESTADARSRTLKLRNKLKSATAERRTAETKFAAADFAHRESIEGVGTAEAALHRAKNRPESETERRAYKRATDAYNAAELKRREALDSLRNAEKFAQAVGGAYADIVDLLSRTHPSVYREVKSLDDVDERAAQDSQNAASLADAMRPNPLRLEFTIDSLPGSALQVATHKLATGEVRLSDTEPRAIDGRLLCLVSSSMAGGGGFLCQPGMIISGPVVDIRRLIEHRAGRYVEIVKTTAVAQPRAGTTEQEAKV